MIRVIQVVSTTGSGQRIEIVAKIHPVGLEAEEIDRLTDSLADNLMHATSDSPLHKVPLYLVQVRVSEAPESEAQ